MIDDEQPRMRGSRRRKKNIGPVERRLVWICMKEQENKNSTVSMIWVRLMLVVVVVVKGNASGKANKRRFADQESHLKKDGQQSERK